MTEPQLRDYQELAVDFIRDRNRAGLFLDMGLGKTAVCLRALEPRHLPALVVAPKKVAEEVWDVERDIWRPDLSITVAAGTPAARAAALRSSADIVVLGRDNIKDVLAHRTEPFRTLILDELSGFKGRGVRWKEARRIIHAWKIPHVWGLTGTPAPNGYLDLWPQIALLDDGARLGKNITTYRSRYFYPGQQLPNGTIIEWILRDGAEDKIKSRIADVCLYMETDGRVQLPPVTFNDINVELPPKARKAYKELADKLVVDLKAIFGRGFESHMAASAGALTNRLSQIAAGFLYVDDAEYRNHAFAEVHDAKLDAIAEIVDVQTSPLLMFYRYDAERQRLLRKLGKKAHEIREPGVVKAWNRGDVPVLLTHPASAGHGLNLQYGGHTALWTSPTWDLEHWQQGNKRLARSGQAHPVVIHSVLARKTIDQLVRLRLDGKADLQQDLLTYLESPI